MSKTLNSLILFILFISVPSWAKEKRSHETLKLSTLHQKMTGEDWLQLMKIKGQLQPFQTFPVINNDSLQLDLGPAQFQFTIPFR